MERSRLGEAARRFGETVGAEAATLQEAETDDGDPENAMIGAFHASGYEPYRDSAGDVRLHNCPFRALTNDHRGLVCGMNLQIMDGMARGLGLQGVNPVLDPRPGECCVAFRRDPS